MIGFDDGHRGPRPQDCAPAPKSAATPAAHRIRCSTPPCPRTWREGELFFSCQGGIFFFSFFLLFLIRGQRGRCSRMSLPRLGFLTPPDPRLSGATPPVRGRGDQSSKSLLEMTPLPFLFPDCASSSVFSYRISRFIQRSLWRCLRIVFFTSR